MNPKDDRWLAFDHEGISFNNTDAGLASVTAVRRLDYYGFAVMMRPSTFLALTHALKPSEQPSKLVGFISAGGAISTPFLSIDPEADTIRVRQHEGRHRMYAIAEICGDIEVPVAFLLDRDFRAVDVGPELVCRIRGGMFSEAREAPSRFVEGPLFGDAWLCGEEIPAETNQPPMRL